MKLSVASIDRHLVRVVAEGEITMRDFRADGPDPFETLLGAGWASHRVVLDFARVTFVDSSAIGWLMTCRRAFERAGGSFVVHSVQPRVRQVLDLLRVGKMLPLPENEQSALAIVSGSVQGLNVAPQPSSPAAVVVESASVPAPQQVSEPKSRAATSRTRRRSAA